MCRELGMSEATYHRWRNQLGGLKAEDAKRFKDLERENATLKQLLADAELLDSPVASGLAQLTPPVV